MSNGVVIIGAGHGGVQAAASLRDEGFGGRILLIGDEAELPYHKPPLSKTFIKDTEAKPQILRAEAFYSGASIDLLFGESVESLDPVAKRLKLASGNSLAFDKAVLATGSRPRLLPIEGGPLVSLAVATNVLAALTGSASGGLTIALQSLAATYMELAQTLGIDPALMHRVSVIGAGTLDSLPHNGAVVTLLAVCGSTHREGYMNIVVVGIVGPIIGLAAVIALGSALGSF